MAKPDTKAKNQPTTTPKIAVKTKTVFGFPTQADSLIQYFQMAGDNDEAWFQVLDMFPIPIEIFSPDGTVVFVNRSHLDFINCKEPSLVIGKYNVLKDPVCMDQLGYRDELQRAFKGEMVMVKGFPAPIHDLVERNVINEKPFEKATMDLYLYPIWKDDKLHLVVCVFVIRSLYLGRPDVIKAKEYIDKNWQGKYDPKAVAKSVNMSVAQLYNLFKQHIGMTPGDYHKKVKVEQIKAKLADKSLSIKEVFVACGEDSRSWLSTVFKKLTGMSPKQYRENLP
jgi:AraC-like DNA-binding protein